MIPMNLPMVINALEAPALAEPRLRMSNPRSFANMYDGFMQPTKYPIAAQPKAAPIYMIPPFAKAPKKHMQHFPILQKYSIKLKIIFP